MASFNPNQAVNSEAYRYNAYINYNYLGNSMGITEEEYEVFKSLYGASFADWDAKFESTDVDQYVIADEDLNTALDAGVEDTENKTGYDKKDENTSLGMSLGSAGAGVAMGAGFNLIAGTAVKAATKKAIKEGTTKAVAKAVAMPAVVAGAMVLAEGLLNVLTATKFNRDGAKAIAKIAELMRGEGRDAIQNSLDILAGLEADTVARTELAALNAQEHGENADMITKAFLEGESGVNDLLKERADLEVQIKEKEEELKTLQANPEENADKITALNDELGGLRTKLTAIIDGINAFNAIFAVLTEEYNTSKEENQSENEAINAEIAAGAVAYNSERANIEFQQGKIEEERSLHGKTLAASIVNMVASTVNVASSVVVAAKGFATAIITMGSSIAGSVMAIAGGAASGTAIGFEIDNMVKIVDGGNAADDFQEEILEAIDNYEGGLTHYVANEELSISYENVIASSEYEGEGAQADG